jgi:hypothetical protein
MTKLYSVNSRAYLARAKDRLNQKTLEALFYAAFELRCCVEARQDEYATALEFLKTKIKAWEIGKTAKTLARVFASNKIAHIKLVFDDSAEFDLFYTPVEMRLYKAAERLGSLLHCMKSFKEASDPFWKETRAQLLEIYRDAWVACRGTLLTPMFFDQPLKVESPPTGLVVYLSRATKEKQTMTIKVDYLDQPPADWVCDL